MVLGVVLRQSSNGFELIDIHTRTPGDFKHRRGEIAKTLHPFRCDLCGEDRRTTRALASLGEAVVAS